MSKKNRKRIEELERQVAYLEAMVRHYIELYELEKSTPPATVPSRQPSSTAISINL